VGIIFYAYQKKITWESIGVAIKKFFRIKTKRSKKTTKRGGKP